MRNVTMTFSAAFALCFVPELFSGDLAWYISIFCRDMQVCLVTAFSLMSLPKSRVDVKSVCLAFLIYAVVEAQLGLLNALTGFSLYDSMWYIITFIGGALYLFNRYKQFHFKSDKIKNHENIHLCFWKPKEVRHLIPTIIGCCFGGLSVYTDFHVYSFRGKFVSRPVRESIVKNSYTVIDTGISNQEAKDKLNSLLGQPAGWLGIRCIFILKPVLSSLGEKFRIKSCLDLIPSLYSTRIPTWKKTQG